MNWLLSSHERSFLLSFLADPEYVLFEALCGALAATGFTQIRKYATTQEGESVLDKNNLIVPIGMPYQLVWHHI